MSEYKAVPYHFDRDEEVIALLDKVFSPWIGDREYFNWKYKQFKGHEFNFPNAWIIEDKNRIIAFNGYIPRIVKINQQEHFVLQSFDTVTDTDYRGKGLFGILQREVYRKMKQNNIKWVYGWTSDIGFKVFTKKMGWTVWGRQRFLMKVLDPDAFLDSKLDRPLVKKLVSALLTGWGKLTRRPVSSKYQVAVEKQLGEGVDELVQKGCAKFDMGALRNRQYLNWRAAHPSEDITFLCLRQSRQTICAYAAHRITGDTFDIYDILADTRDDLTSLLSAIEALAEEHHCSKIQFRVNADHQWAMVFKRAGYFWSKTEFPLLGKIIVDEGFGCNIKNLHWTMFDRNE